MTFQHKHTAALTAAVLLMQAFGNGVPVTKLRSADTVRSAAAFTAMLAAAPAPQTEPFETLRYDAAAGQLYRDGVPAGDSFCGFTVEDGQLSVAAPSAGEAESVSAQQAAESMGYTITEEPDGSISLQSPFQSARLIVRSSCDIDPMGGTVAAEGYRDLHVIQYGSVSQAYAAYCAYQNDSSIAYAVPDRYYRADLSAVPSEQTERKTAAEDKKSWGYYAIGTDSYLSWLEETGQTLHGITVAVLDTGIYAEHNWFQGRIAENGMDCTDSLVPLKDTIGHGTHCAGIICQNTPDAVRILPVKVISDQGYGSDLMLYCGMMHAIEQKADIISMSLGNDGDAPLLHEAIRAAYEADIPCCAAAGNDAFTSDYTSPAGFDEVFCISAVMLLNDSEDYANLNYSDPLIYDISDYSNIGPQVDFAAPGTNIISAFNQSPDSLISLSGTSMATPFAAAVCADLLCCKPETDIETLRQMLTDSAMRLPDSRTMEHSSSALCYGAGLVSLRQPFTENRYVMPPVFEVTADDKQYETYEDDESAEVRITAPDKESVIYYTTDGSEPDKDNGTLYKEPFSVTESTLLRAAAFSGSDRSESRTACICIGGKQTANPYVVENGELKAYNGVLYNVDLTENFPDGSLKAVADGACKGSLVLRSITLPDSVTKIGNEAFAQTALLHLTANGVTEVGEDAFAYCTVSNLNLGTLTGLGASAFRNCSELTSMPLFAESLKDIPDYAFYGCESMGFNDNDFTHIESIGEYAFSKAGLPGTIELTSLKTLGQGAFKESGIADVVLSENITVLEPEVFLDCYGMQKLTAPGLTKLKEYSVAGPQLKEFSDLLNITELEQDAFCGTAFYPEDMPVISFDKLEKLPQYGFSIIESTSVLRLPTVTEYTPGLCSFVTPLVWLPNAEQISMNDDNLTAIRVSDKLKSAKLTSNSDVMYIIGPKGSCIQKEADKFSIPYFEERRLYCDEEAVSFSENQEPMLHAAYVDDDNLSLRWFYVASNGTETEMSPDLIRAEGKAYDLRLSTMDAFNETGTRLYRAALYDGSERIDSKDITVTVYAYDENIPETPKAETLDYELDSANYRESSTVIRIGEEFLFDGTCPTFTIHADEMCKIRLKAVNKNVSVQCTLLSILLGAQTISDTECAEVIPGFYSLRFRGSRNDDVFKMPLVLKAEAVQHTLLDADITACDTVYTGKPVRPQFRVTYQDQLLEEGKDYEIDGDLNVTESGQYTFTLKGCGDYYGEVVSTFRVIPQSPEKERVYTDGDSCTVSMPEASGTPAVYCWKPEKDRYCLCKDSMANGTVSVCDPDGTVIAAVSGIYSRWTELTVDPEKEYRIIVSGFYPESKTTVSFRLVADYCLLDDAEAELTEKVRYGEEPQLTLKDGDTILKEGRDYSVLCVSSGKYLGRAGLTVTGKGRYVGEMDLFFYIIPEELNNYPNPPEDGQPNPDTINVNTPFVNDGMTMRYPGLVEQYEFTAPADDTYTLTLPDPAVYDHTALVYLNGGEIPEIIKEPTWNTELKESDQLTILLICNYLRESSITDVIKPYTICVSSSDRLYQTEAGGISYVIENGLATVTGIMTDDAGIFIPGAIEDPETGNAIPVAAIDEIAFAPYARSCTIITDSTAVAEICRNADYNCYLTKAAPTLPGDLNGDEAADYHDVMILQQYLAERNGIQLNAAQLEAADCNQDGSIDFADLFTLMQQMHVPSRSTSLADLYEALHSPNY